MKKRYAIALGVLIAISIIIAALASGVFVVPDKRNAAERIGDAIRELPNGEDKAMDQLNDRSIGQRIGDTVRGVGK